MERDITSKLMEIIVLVRVVFTRLHFVRVTHQRTFHTIHMVVAVLGLDL